MVDRFARGGAGLARRRTATEWQSLVRLWRRGGMSAAEFAAARELSPRTLQWWSSELKRRDRLEAASQTELRFVELKLREPPVAPTASVPAQLASSPPVSGIEVVLSGQRVVRVSPGFDAVTLQRVVVSLEARPC